MDKTQVPIQKLELAARHIEKSLTIDSRAPTLLDLLNVSGQCNTNASGLTDRDYPILSGTPEAVKSTAQIKLVGRMPLPTDIMQHFGRVQSHCMMGLFSEIERAWLTVDSDIYIWKYEQNTDLAYYDGITDTVLTIGLVRPKFGVFHNFVQYLLIVTTTIDIVILAVTFTTTDHGDEEIQLIPEPVFTLPTDGIVFTTISGSESGRVFLGSKNGCLYEIVYHAEAGWFGKRCKLVNLSSSIFSYLVPSFLSAALNEDDGIAQISIDNSRQIMYVLTEKGTIQVYDLGHSGNHFSLVTKVSYSTLSKQAVQIVKTLDNSNFRPVVSISAVDVSESAHLHLVAVNECGVRYYFTTHNLQHQHNTRPHTLILVHVRLPPGYSANVTIRPKSIQMAHYDNRNLILIGSSNAKDTIWCISSDLFPFSTALMEMYTTINVDGPVLAIAQVPNSDGHLENLQIEQCPLVVRQQISITAKKYVILTSDGVYIYQKQRPVDVLRQLLSDENTDMIKTFFVVQKEDQACATCLSLCTQDDNNIVDFASRAFFIFGGEPTLASGANTTAMDQSHMFHMSTFSPNIVSTPGPHHPPSPSSFINQSTQPISPPQSPTTAVLEPSGPFIFSSKHNGLYLYLSRILRQIWCRRCVEKVYVIDTKTNYNTSTITSENCRFIIDYLSGLHRFLQSNTQFTMTDGATQAILEACNATLNSTRINNKLTVQDAQIEERSSLNAIKMFVCHCEQILNLWQILCDHQFHQLIGILPENQQQILQNTTFKDLFLYGQDICTVLIQTLIDSYLGDNASVDAISQKLREVCPHLYRVEDATCSKANEMLITAKMVQNIDEKQEIISTALQLCKSVAPNVNLSEICRQFSILKAYEAITDLCITCARKVDPNNIAENFYKNDVNMADQEGRYYYLRRMTVYKEIFIMLDTILNENTPTTGQTLIIRIINEILLCSDEILHVALYDWMMSKQLYSDLIKIPNPTLETYLIRTSQQNEDDVTLMDILWKYYEKNNNHSAAAKILDALSTKSSKQLSLTDRIEYLTRAIMCMRSDKVGYAPYLGVFLRDLEDKLEVARVQEQVLEAVQQLRGIHPSAESAISALNSTLYTVSHLYGNFAEPFELWECKLSIIDTAGYNDVNLVEQIWRKILKCELQRSEGSANSKMTHVLTKLKLMGKVHGIQSLCFPLAFLVSELEQLSTYLKANEAVVPETFVNMGIPIDTLVDIYNKLILSMGDVQIWQQPGNEGHLIESLCILISLFTDHHSSYGNVQKRKIIAQCQDTIAGVLSSLYSKPDTDCLIGKLRAVQNKVSRL